MRKILITGGCGFIGSNLLRYWLRNYQDDLIINVDALTYAARPAWVEELLNEQPELQQNLINERINIQDQNALSRVMRKYEPDHVIHLAAESHVCRSIAGPHDFIHTNIVGTFNLLEEFKSSRKGKDGRFLYVSTDEVFGQLTEHEPKFFEGTPIKPRSPYAASKASGDLLVQAYYETYGLNTVITNCSNNYGPNQHEEKLIPRTISRFMNRELMTIYGTGEQIRDWISVEDHCTAIDIAFHKGKSGERYCVGGSQELKNIEVIDMVNSKLEKLTGMKSVGYTLTNDRPHDDFRYAIDSSKLKGLGWICPTGIDYFSEMLGYTIKWYLRDYKESGAV